ncbi:class I SAM-dependent methyltransferase [Candidatus Gottesmanbacteria bacterium]|nr:class I SAM-dependent methyltransferase [Candidatus Gottesmanbacteria bacterium]
MAILKNARLLAPKALVTSRLSLLDIGCAMGILLEEAQKQGIAAYGIDISADAVKYCKKKGFTVWQGTAETAKIPKEKTFDIVTAFEVIEHEADPVAMMRRVYKLLKNGGIALITTPNHDTFWRKLMGKWWVGYRHPEHINFFNRRSLDELFRRVGFSQIIIKKDPPRPFPLSFLFIRSADYFPGMGWLLRPIGNLIHRLNITNPINPWDDIMVIGVK